VSSVGITATRHGLTAPQRHALICLLIDLTAPLGEFGTFRHGDCVGGDVQGAEAARLLGYWIIGHPPSNPRLRAYFPSDETLPEQGYHVRNRTIVDSSALLTACPDGPERERSGTWSTVRYARQMHAQIVVIMPDGTIVR
jgi:hypothetical protein